MPLEKLAPLLLRQEGVPPPLRSERARPPLPPSDTTLVTGLALAECGGKGRRGDLHYLFFSEEMAAAAAARFDLNFGKFHGRWRGSGAAGGIASDLTSLLDSRGRPTGPGEGGSGSILKSGGKEGRKEGSAVGGN